MIKKLGIVALIGLIMSMSLGILCGMSTDNGSELAILMYHNIIPDNMKPNKYEVNLKDLEQDFKYIRDKGYTTVLPSQLIAYTRGAKMILPKKIVMVTFDDGFYNYNKYLEPLLNKYDINCVISVVCGFSKFNKNTSATGRYIYMDYDDMESIAKSDRVEIAGHSNDLHWQKDGRLGANKKRGETSADYRQVFMSDCALMENNLSKIGIKLSCYTYPYGAFCSDSEAMLKERGYNMTLVCEEKVNAITPDSKCLYKLGRYNRSGYGRSAEQILAKSL